MGRKWRAMLLSALVFGVLFLLHFAWYGIREFWIGDTFARVENSVMEHPDSAWGTLEHHVVEPFGWDEEWEAYWALLQVEASYGKTKTVADSVLDVAWNYYGSNSDVWISRRTAVLLYKGISLCLRHKEKEAFVCLLEAYENKDDLLPRQQMLLVDYLKAIYYRNGLYEEAADRLGTMDSIPIINNKVVLQAKDIAVAEMRYEQEKERRAYWQWGMAVVSYLFVVILLTFYYAVRKKLRERELMAEILGYTRRINELDARSEENEKVQKEKDLLLERIKYNEIPMR